MSAVLTPDLTRAFWAHMQNRYGSSVEEKNESALVHAAAVLLDTLSIQDRERFLESYVTTLGNVIYIPFEVGAEQPGWSLWHQIVTCVHEHQHILQGRREGWMTFGSRYLTSSSWRAGYEAEAYGCNMEMEYWRFGALLDPARLAARLRGYGCDNGDIMQAAAQLDIRRGVVKRGAVENPATKEAIAWLKANAPELRVAQ